MCTEIGWYGKILNVKTINKAKCWVKFADRMNLLKTNKWRYNTMNTFREEEKSVKRWSGEDIAKKRKLKHLVIN